MKIVLTTALLVISFALPTTWPQLKPPQKSLAISNVTIIDVIGAPAKPNMSVIITEGRIATIAKTGEVEIPKNAQTVDGTGQVLDSRFMGHARPHVD